MAEWARTHDSAQQSAKRPDSVPTRQKHAAMLEELDNKQMSLGKAINEAEGALASKEAEFARLKEELTALEEEDPAADHALDATAYVLLSAIDLYVREVMQRLADACGCVRRLRLQLYRGLGFEPVMERNGQMKKMLIRQFFFYGAAQSQCSSTLLTL